MPAFFLPNRVSFAVLTAVLCCAPLRGASPRDELLRYVPEDVGFCLVVQDLRASLARVADSPFARRVCEASLVKSLLASDEWAKLRKVEGYLSRHLGVSFASLRDDLLGDAFLFAYRPGPPGKPEQEQGLFLLRARDEKVLADFVAKLNALQQGTGELKALDEREHEGVKYHRRQEAKATTFYLLKGPVLLFTGQEALLREAIDLERKAAPDAEPPLLRRLRELKLEQAVVALAVNPRAWDGALAAKAADPGATMAAGFWRALQGVGLALEVERDVRLRLSLRMKTSELPASVRRFLAGARRPSELWASFPKNALVAAAGRLDLSALAESLGESMSKSARQTAEAELDRTVGAIVGRSVVKELLPALGPDWGVCVTAPPAEGRGWAPAVTLALKVARGDEGDPTDEAVRSALQSWVQLAILGHNKLRPERPLSLRSVIVDGVRGRFLSGDGVFPEGVQPGFALKAGYLVLVSSSAELRRFKAGPATAAEEVPLLRVSLKGWRAYLGQRREQLAEALAGKEGLTRERALQKIDDLRAGLELIDRVELRQATAPGFASFTLTVVPSAPLRDASR
jgi:hypothetical protein